VILACFGASAPVFVFIENQCPDNRQKTARRPCFQKKCANIAQNPHFKRKCSIFPKKSRLSVKNKAVSGLVFQVGRRDLIEVKWVRDKIGSGFALLGLENLDCPAHSCAPTKPLRQTIF
jgi:hypothetical protein